MWASTTMGVSAGGYHIDLTSWSMNYFRSQIKSRNCRGAQIAILPRGNTVGLLLFEKAPRPFCHGADPRRRMLCTGVFVRFNIRGQIKGTHTHTKTHTKTHTHILIYRYILVQKQ